MRPLLLTLLAKVVEASLGFESIQLEHEDTKAFPAISFARGPGRPPQAKCKAWPGNTDWPSDSEWQLFNASLDRALLKPNPPAAACYRGPEYDAAKCSYLLNNATDDDFYYDDPLTVLTQWPQGETCLPALNATGSCTLGGFPVYVVNATTVKHVQAAVNFARNKNIRLVIKNTGHDFGGRSLGAGSLSVWTHHLQDFEFLPHFRKGNYSGPAAHFGSGLEQWELFNYMFRHNVTIVGSGYRGIGANGGWFASGGHGNLASRYGLGADQALVIHVVTADGRYVVADEDNNTDLFHALRGGGGSTYGVVTSVIVKAYPPTTLSASFLSIACNPPPDTDARAPFAPLSAATNYVNDTERFWAALGIYFRYKKTVVDAGGVDWDYLYPLGDDSYSFRTRVTFPGVTADEAAGLLQPLYDDLARAGFSFSLNRTELEPTPYAPTSLQTPTSSNGLANTRYRSRLLPRRNWDDDALWDRTFAAIRSVVEDGGYILHGLSIGPSEKAAGWPGRSAAVNPAWREAVLHLCYMTTQPSGLTALQAVDEETRMQGFLKPLRDLTPGAGSYMNEGDPGEPDWQQSFFGANYKRLLQIKRKRDPWGVFWAQTTVGSEAWEVVTLDGYPRSQNGRLCRTDAE
ncbi:Inactive tetrahydrocannabinolic acid synthase [Madurella fahalii]|uniref:Inactive tetrahydrocannabinolic acid synthase n=1 Tax=Madurella fahalii TaxID=1157608 RepID=A0ABQ0G2H3_9PEZI